MDLYSLPKDMLVKMISTIRKDMEKEYQPYKDVFEEIKPYLKRCMHHGCKAITIFKNYDEHIYLNCHFASSCRNCNELFCDKHYIMG